MAKSGYHMYRKGYAEVLNREPEIRDVCQQAGLHAAQEAFAIGGGHAQYVVDTRSGANRFHTRVRTYGIVAFRSENKWHALRNALPRI